MVSPSNESHLFFNQQVGGEGEIRTPDDLGPYCISSAAHSTRLCHLSFVNLNQIDWMQIRSIPNEGEIT